jgi:hypothetical protein
VTTRENKEAKWLREFKRSTPTVPASFIATPPRRSVTWSWCHNALPSLLASSRTSRKAGLDGRRVRTGGATYYLSIDLEGKFAVKVRPDKRITRAANQEKAFRGRIANAENVKSSDDLVAMWNEDHPDDLVE